MSTVTESVHDSGSGDSFTYELPPPPNPSEDKALEGAEASHSGNTTPPPPNSLDVFTLTPVTALKLLCGGIQALVRITGEYVVIPPARAYYY